MKKRRRKKKKKKTNYTKTRKTRMVNSLHNRRMDMAGLATNMVRN
jgi:hypothetical protein